MSPVVGFLLSAVCGVLSFPPLGGWFLAYVALIPFLHAAVASPPRRAFWWGYLSGFLFFAGLLYWIGLNSGAPPVLTWASAAAVVMILASVWAVTAWAVSRVSRRFGLEWAVLLFVVLYVFFEVLYGTGELGFPWAVWGLTQVAFPPAMQIADLTDVYGLSVWVLSVNAILFLVWKVPARRVQWIVVLLLIAALPISYGLLRLSQFRSGGAIPVAAVQANTPVSEKWETPVETIVDSYLSTSAPLAHSDTRLVVWTETAVPAPIRYRPWLRTSIQAFSDSTGMSLLTGASDFDPDPVRGTRAYNAAFLFHPGSRDLQRSVKIHLVPFGERIPGQSLFPALGSLHLGQAEWVPGDSSAVFPDYDGVPPFGCLICYEVIFPEVAADLVRRGARFLTNITNDGWYGNSSGPYQHLALTQLRAVVVRRSIVRGANTGISALILPTGELTGTLPYNTVGALRGWLPARTEITVAVRLARAWPYVYTVLLAVVLVLLLIKARRQPAAAQGT